MADSTKDPKLSENNYIDLNPPAPNFKSVRESKGLTLKDVFKITRIGITHLASIENNDFHLLPPPVFTKSFIKIYAKILGVESTSTVTRYEQYLATMNTACRDGEIKKPPARARVNYRRLFWGSLILVVAVSAIFFLFLYKSQIDILKKPVESAPASPITKAADDTAKDIQRNTPDPADGAKKTEENTAQSTTDTPVQRSTNEAASKSDIQQKQVAVFQKIISTQKEITEKYPLIMEARELTWLRIREDHNPPYQILLKPGEKIEKSASQFIIDIGNAGGITVEFQGKSLGNLGKHGEVVHLTLP